jgi:hypothetical protein
MPGMKKIFITALVGYLLIPTIALAETCCMCKTCDEEGCSNLTPLLLYGNTVTTTQKCFRALSTCEIKEDTGCQLTTTPTVAPTPEMTDLTEELGLQNVVLGVAIPNLHFSAPPTKADTEGNIYIPWAGEYVKAIYNFAVVVISILAVVVLILSGAQIITSAGGPAKGAAYKRITQAIIGLFIAWGSYVVLYTINPGLTTFNSLKIKYIVPDIISTPSDFDVDNTAVEGDPNAKPKGCRVTPPDIYKIPATDLKLDRINIKGGDEKKCAGGLVYPKELVDAALAAQKETGIPAGFLLAQAQHEGGKGFVSAIKSGKVSSQLWGRKCPKEKINVAQRKDVWQDAHPACLGARAPTAKNEMTSACEAAGCQVLSTYEWCPEEKGGNTPKYKAWACFNKVEAGNLSPAAIAQGVFYRDTIGKYCKNCGSLSSYEGSVIGFAARMSCVLFGGVHDEKWDNCLIKTIRDNCLEDSRNTAMIAISDKIGLQGACVSGNDADAGVNMSTDPYDCGKLGCNK